MDCRCIPRARLGDAELLLGAQRARSLPRGVMNPDRWLTIRQAAAVAIDAEGKPTPLRTMRRRLYHLDARSGGRLLKWVSPRRVLVSAEALLRELRTDPDFADAELSSFHGRLEDHEKKLLALRQAHRSLKVRVKTLESERRR